MNTFVFAFGAGLLATVNPCGFAMLPAYLAEFLGDTTGPERIGPVGVRLAQGLVLGGAVSAGFAGTFTVFGLAVAAGLRSVVTVVPWAALLIGVSLTAVGIAAVAGRHVGLNVGSVLAPSGGHSLRRAAAFGAAYAVASLSCTLAVLLAVVAQALATRNPLQLVATFAAYALGSATMLVTLSISAALATEALHRHIRRLFPYMARLGGLVLIAAGIYLVAYWLPAIAGGNPNKSLAAIAGRVSGQLSTLLHRHIGLLSIIAAALITTAVAIAIWWRHRRPAGPPGNPACCTVGFPTPQSYGAPGELDNTERPSPGQEPVRAREHATDSEQQHEVVVAPFEDIHHHHERDSEDAEERDHDGDATRPHGLEVIRVIRRG